ncbi:MAG: ABC transporter permease, partial [Gaiellaceae bacterium]
VLGMALGLFVSAFARSEFQAVQFLPAFILPQILLCGLLAPRDEMAELLYWISWGLPVTYAYGALDLVTRGVYDSELAAYVLVVCGFIAAALVLGAGTLRRRTS